MFEHVFLDEFSQKKLLLVRYLSKNGQSTHSIHGLSAKLHLSFQTTADLLSSIQLDFEGIFDSPLQNTARKIIWYEDRFSYNRYLRHLIHSSAAYQFILASLMKPQMTLKEFCYQHYLSTSTLRRKLNNLKVYTEKQGLRLNIANMSFSGQESLIRTFYITCIWYSSLGEDLYTEEALTQQIRALIDQLQLTQTRYVHPKELFIILFVCRIRTDQQKSLESRWLEEQVSHYLDERLLTHISFFSDDLQEATCNVNYVIYLVYLAPYFSDTNDSRLLIKRAYYQHKQANCSPLTAAAEELMLFLGKHHMVQSDSLQHDDFLQLNLFTTLLNYWIFQGQNPIIAGFIKGRGPLNNQQFLSLETAVFTLLKKMSRRKQLAWIAQCQSELATALTQLLLPYYEKEQQTNQLVIGIVPIPNFHALYELRIFLKELRFVEVVMTTKDSEEIDFYISTIDSLIPNRQKDFFIVDLSLNSEYIPKLFTAIWQVYQQKSSMFKNYSEEYLWSD